jgi:hypothetical protein
MISEISKMKRSPKAANSETQNMTLEHARDLLNNKYGDHSCVHKALLMLGAKTEVTP